MIVAGTVLRFQADAGTGLPRLIDSDGRLTAEVFALLENEIRRRFEELVGSKPGAIYHLPTGHVDAQAYCISVQRARGQRCPTLELLPTSHCNSDSAAEPKPAAQQPAHNVSPLWWELLDQDLERIAEPLRECAFVVADIRAIIATKPDRLLPLLLAGYLRVGDGICRAHGDDGRNDYARAARTLQAIFGQLLPRGALDDLISRPSPNSD